MVLTSGKDVTLDVADIRDSRVRAMFFFNTTNNWKNLKKSEKNNSNFMNLIEFLTE